MTMTERIMIHDEIERNNRRREREAKRLEALGTMTNRELWDFLQNATDKGAERQIMAEMAKRVNCYKAFCWNPTKELRQHIRQIFSQYKLNGAGDETR